MFKHKIRVIFTVLVLSLALVATAFAHSGRTDSGGGHRDNKNASGLGSYHYHHGYPAHLHPNGVCPYAQTENSSSVSPSSGYAEYISTVRNNVTIYVNGEKIDADNFLYNGTTYVSVRALTEAIDGEIDYDSTNKSITITIE